MRISAAFPSEYLKAADLDGKPVLLTMNRIEMKDIGDDHKPVLYCEELEKGIVLNKTNASAIADGYGDDTVGWPGQKIVAFEAQVSNPQGKIVPAIRIRMPKAQAKTAPAPMDDAIPF